MNVENILKVADAIERHEIEWLGFNMSHYCAVGKIHLTDHSGHNCGTVACIAGWGAAVSGVPKSRMTEDFDAETPAMEFMGLSEDQMDHLFYAKSHPHFSSHKNWNNITQDQAVAVLRHLAATGEVDWSISA